MNQFEILDSKVQDEKLLYLIQHRSDRGLQKWVTFDYLSKRKHGLELIEEFNHKDERGGDGSDSECSFVRKRPVSCYSLENGDSIRRFELIGTVEQEGSENILKCHPRQWVFKVEWNAREEEREAKIRCAQYYTYEQLMEYDVQKIIEMWEGTFEEEPYREFYELLKR